jgi:hypothetical protein
MQRFKLRIVQECTDLVSRNDALHNSYYAILSTFKRSPRLF